MNLAACAKLTDALTIAVVCTLFLVEAEVALTVQLTDGADTVESSLEKAVTHTGSRGTGLVASADAPAVSARAPSRRRKSNRKRQKVGESLSRFDPCAGYIDSASPHGHTVCVAFFMVDLAAAVTPLNDDGAYNNRGAPGSIFKAVIHTGLRGRGRVGSANALAVFSRAPYPT